MEARALGFLKEIQWHYFPSKLKKSNDKRNLQVYNISKIFTSFEVMTERIGMAMGKIKIIIIKTRIYNMSE